MPYYILILTSIIVGCSGKNLLVCPNNPDFIVSGQSNANMNWSYFEKNTGYKVKNIAKGGYTIQQLIEELPNEDLSCISNVKGIFFIHGEHDALWGTNPNTYKHNVERYRLMVKDVPLLISLVGYTTNPNEDVYFDKIRYVQEYSGYKSWYVVYKDAHLFPDKNMLLDDIHYTPPAENIIMTAFENYLLNSTL